MNDSIDTWLTSLAAKQPTPGGGGVAALSAAVAAGLVGMVSIYTTGPKWLAVSDRMQAISDVAAGLRVAALDLMTADEIAFSKVGAAYAMPKNTDEQKQSRKTAIQQALVGAALPPQLTAVLAAKIVSLSEELVSTGNPNVISDVAVAASTAKAALEAAIVNIEINSALITDVLAKTTLNESVTAAETAIQAADAVIKAVRHRIQA